MSDITSPGDFTQAQTLRTVAPTEVARPTGTVSDRPVEEEAQTNAGTNDNPSSPETTAFSAPESAGSDTEEEQDPIVRATSRLEELLADSELPRNTRLRIELDEEEGRFIYQSIDRETGEVVSQFPPEEIIDLLRQFRSPTGIAVDDEA